MEPIPPPRAGGLSAAVIALVVLAALCMVGLPFVGVMAAIAVPNFVMMQYRAKRAEVPANVDGIKTAQLAYDAAFDGFVAQEAPVPRDPAALGKDQVPWQPSEGFDNIGWRPDFDVRGAYWVEVKPGGEDFVVHGMCDVDGDGVPAHYTATRSIHSTLITPPDVY